jgi:iron complex outermembrane recepter protein
MAFQLNPVARTLALAFGGAASALLIALPASAQTTAQAQALERVEVTGSLIRRIEGETALPVTTLRVEELQKAGVTNAEQAVKYITQQQGGTVTSGSVSGTNGAAAYADLRSLGATRTLVLLNGKRVAANPFAVVAVDLNTLPLSAVDRIETLSDGASAIYGTDAIAGVINFITRRSYQGAAVGAQVQIPEAGGAETYTADVLAGFGDLSRQGWNILGGINYRRQNPMGGTERDFSQTSYIPSRGFNGLSPTTFPANYNQAGAVAGAPPTVPNTNPTLPNCFPPSSIFAPQPVVGLGTNRCGADTQVFTYTVPKQDQMAGFLRGSLALGKDHTAYLEYFRAINTVQTQIAPSPEGGLSMPPTSPFYPGNGITPITDPNLDTTRNISIAWRTTFLGPRRGEQENTTQRAVAGIEGSVAAWDYQASLLWSNAEVVNNFLGGWPMTQALRNGVSGAAGAPFLNPFGTQTAAGQAYMEANQVLGRVQEGESTLQSFAATATRQFGSLPGGPIGIALAAELRKEEMVYRTDVAKVSQAASSGLAGAGALREGDRDVKALGLEMNFPVLRNLELGVAVRYDDYSDFGGTTNPKFTLRFSPTNQVLLRASYNEGFAAPTLYNLYLPNSTTFTANRYNDPVLCPGGTVNLAAGGVASRDCLIQFQQQQGGNTQLQPETSKAYTLGFVLQPTAAFSFGMDYWRYHIEDQVSTVGEQTIFADPAKYANLYIRCSRATAAQQFAIGACQTPGGDPLAYIVNTFQNLGDVVTTGLDWQANWTGGATPYGRFSVGVRGTYVIKYEFQVEPNGRWFDPVGNYSPQFGGPVIRYQQVTTINWQRDAWSASLFHRWLTGYKDQNAVPAPFNDNTVGDYSIFDLSATYRGFRNMILSAGVLNVLDTDPPFTNQVGRFQARAYDDRFHNPLGRTYMVSARYEF